MYIQRALESIVQEMSSSFRVVLLTGPRQVGKTTLLEHIEKNRAYISLDDMNWQAIAREDPAAFIQRLKLPVLIDEVQYAPSLFPYIKLAVDRDKTPGQFWLTGSQQFDMMKNISESLAGRVAVLRLQGVSLAEEQRRPDLSIFVPTETTLRNRVKAAQVNSLTEIFHKIWRGSYPDVVLNEGKYWERFYESYVTTYIQRDVRDYLQINNFMAFYKFMQIIASRTGQLLNYRDMASDIGVSEPTLKNWVTVLQASGIIYLLPPYFNNHNKRLIKTPKVYFMDTGLCCYLTGWLSAEVLERGAMSGALLETYVVSEIIKSYLNNGKNPRLYFYRDRDKREVDLLIEMDGVLYPVEIKKTASIKNIDIKNFNVLQQLKTPIGHGAVVCFVDSLLPLNKDIDAVPVSYI